MKFLLKVVTFLVIFLCIILFLAWMGDDNIFVKIRSEKELLRLEEMGRALAEREKYLAPVAFKNLSKSYLDEKYYKENSSSAFAVQFNGRIFLISAGHVFINQTPSEIPHMYIDGNSMIIDSKLEISEILDIAASDITKSYPFPPHAAVLKPVLDGLSKTDPIIIICNKYVFKVPVRVGFFEKMSSADSFQNSYVKMQFTGVGISNGCSGSPVVDFDGFVRGMVVRTTLSGQFGLAIPVETIINFLNDKFF